VFSSARASNPIKRETPQKEGWRKGGTKKDREKGSSGLFPDTDDDGVVVVVVVVSGSRKSVARASPSSAGQFELPFSPSWSSTWSPTPTPLPPPPPRPISRRHSTRSGPLGMARERGARARASPRDREKERERERALSDSGAKDPSFAFCCKPPLAKSGEMAFSSSSAVKSGDRDGFRFVVVGDAIASLTLLLSSLSLSFARRFLHPHHRSFRSVCSQFPFPFL